jgi:hypothetical protein
MSIDKLKLLLTGLEAEVVEEALELFVQARPVPMDGRFEYRYRAARSVLASLRQGNRELGTFPPGDDEEAGPVEDVRPGRPPLRDQIED